MFAGHGPSQAAQSADVVARAVGALALAALAVIHVVDLPATLGPTPLVGAGYFAILAAAVPTRGGTNTPSHFVAGGAARPPAAPRLGGDGLAPALPRGVPPGT